MAPCHRHGSARRAIAAAALVLLAAGVAITLAAPPALADDRFVETPYGPLGPGDRDLLVRVRYAGLWEVPAGELARERGSTEAIREIGGFIADEHVELDEAVVAVAAELGVEVPSGPHADHQVFLDRLERASGEQFDQEFVQLLREAHGLVYPLVAHVRAGTRNDLVRELAQTAEEFIGRHLEYLESSGLVDWVHIPPPPEPGGARSRFLSAEPAGVDPVLVWLLLGVATAAGTMAVIRTVRPW